jgi:ribonuclease BN (tRNA processing enzyme)
VIVKVGGCFGSELPGYHSPGFLVNGRLLLEGGTVTTTFTWEEQLAVTDVCVSHVHLDHVKELAFLADNRAGRSARPFTVAAPRQIIDELRRSFFNDRLWPDFSRIPSRAAPVVAYRTLAPGRFAPVAGLAVKPVATSHPVPSFGYVLREPGASLVYTGDTGPTLAIWKAARALPDLKALIVETSFPNGMEELAVKSGHLTASLLERELEKLDRPGLPVYVVHMKPLYLEEIAAELRGIKRFRIEMMRQNRSYTVA